MNTMVPESGRDPLFGFCASEGNFLGGVSAVLCATVFCTAVFGEVTFTDGDAGFTSVDAVFCFFWTDVFASGTESAGSVQAMFRPIHKSDTHTPAVLFKYLIALDVLLFSVQKTVLLAPKTMLNHSIWYREIHGDDS